MTISLLLDHLSKSVISHLFFCITETCLLNGWRYSDMAFNSQTPPEGPGYCKAQADARTGTGSSLVVHRMAELQLVWASPCCKVATFGRYIITAHRSLHTRISSRDSGEIQGACLLIFVSRLVWLGEKKQRLQQFRLLWEKAAGQSCLNHKMQVTTKQRCFT